MLMNLTNSTIRVYDEDGDGPILELPTSPPAVRARIEYEETRSIDGGVPVVVHHFSLDERDKRRLGALIAKDDDTVYVVGYAVLCAMHELGLDHRRFVAPDTNRDSAVRFQGYIVGVKRFRTF